MKRIILFAAIWGTAQAATPTQADLDRTVIRAEKAWGMNASASGIRLARLNDCKAGQMAAWTDMVTREITINSACDWQRGYLQVIVTHEIGHLLTGQGHSLNRHSVMFAAPVRTECWEVFDRPHITRADRRLAAQIVALERPTILQGAGE